jgi:hypothetical protein
MLAYLISRKHVPTKMGAMYFGTWIDADGDFLIRRILQTAWPNILFREGDVICFWDMWKWITTSLPLPFLKWLKCPLLQIPGIRTLMTGSLKFMDSYARISA